MLGRRPVHRVGPPRGTQAWQPSRSGSLAPARAQVPPAAAEACSRHLQGQGALCRGQPELGTQVPGPTRPRSEDTCAGPRPGPTSRWEAMGWPWHQHAGVQEKARSACTEAFPTSALPCPPTPPRPLLSPLPCHRSPSPAHRTLWPSCQLALASQPHRSSGVQPPSRQGPQVHVGVGVGWGHHPRPHTTGLHSLHTLPSQTCQAPAGRVQWGAWGVLSAAPVPKFTPWSVSTGTEAHP